ncbi:hypothetical protein Gpo141_00002881 [Globisporangium polare]
MKRQEKLSTPHSRLSLEPLEDEHEIVPVATSSVPSTPREWTRDQLLRLLRAWRDVLNQQENEDADAEAATEPLTSRIYERVIVLCVDEEAYDEAFNGAQSQVPEMQDALTGTHAFIARFNASCGKVNVLVGGKVVARRAMNWFAISESEQRQLVKEQFTGLARFLFSVDEAMYEVIGSILGIEVDDEEAQLDPIQVESQSFTPSLVIGQDAVVSSASRSPTFELPSVETTEDVSTLTEVELLPELAEIEANLPPNVWRRDEIFQLIRAWGAALTDLGDAEVPSRPTTELKNNVFEHYCSEVEGGEGATRRTAVSSWTKIRSLARSFQFITDFNHGKINWMTPGMQIPTPNSWYELSESYQSWVVKKYFRAKNEHTAFSSLYNDMLAPIATNIRATPEWWPPRTHYPKPLSRPKKERKQKRESPAVKHEPTSRLEKSTKKPLVKLGAADRPKKMGRKPNWNDGEVENLMRVLGEVVKESTAEKELSAGVFSAQVFKKFIALCGGDSRRDLPQVRTKIRSLVESCAFISDFDENKIPSIAGSSNDTKKQKSWFALSEPQQRAIVATHFKDYHSVRFTYITADMVPIIAEYSKTWLDFAPRQEPVARRREKVRPVEWSRDELVLFLRAWHEVVAAHRQTHERDTSLIDRIHTQFQVLCGGKSTKRASAILFQTRELLSSYNRLRAYFRNHALREETKGEWFSKSESERRDILSAETNQHVYNVDLDEEVFDLMQQIAQANRQAKPISQAGSEGATPKKPRGQRGESSGFESDGGDFKTPPLKRGAEDYSITQKKKQKLEPRPALKSTLYIEQQDQIKLLKSMLDQVREERDLEREERRKEREEARRELEDWRQERLVERESHRALLRELREAVVPPAPRKTNFRA